LKYRGHLTVPELEQVVVDRGIRIRHATVYRTLNTLEDLGLIHNVTTQDQAARYGLNTAAHQRASCVRCGTLRSIPAAPAAPCSRYWPRRHARLDVPDCGAITLRGLCTHCRILDGAATRPKP
jgi:Fur family transcriptional regulator, ferric uptake regulator